MAELVGRSALVPVTSVPRDTTSAVETSLKGSYAVPNLLSSEKDTARVNKGDLCKHIRPRVARHRGTVRSGVAVPAAIRRARHHPRCQRHAPDGLLALHFVPRATSPLQASISRPPRGCPFLPGDVLAQVEKRFASLVRRHERWVRSVGSHRSQEAVECCVGKRWRVRVPTAREARLRAGDSAFVSRLRRTRRRVAARPPRSRSWWLAGGRGASRTAAPFAEISRDGSWTACAPDVGDYVEGGGGRGFRCIWRGGGGQLAVSCDARFFGAANERARHVHTHHPRGDDGPGLGWARRHPGHRRRLH